MAQTKEQKRAAEAAALLKTLDEAKAAFAGLAEDATDEVKATTQKAIDDAQVAYDEFIKPAETKSSGKKVKVKILLPAVRKFGLGYHVGETGLFEEKQAKEIVDAKYGEYVK